MNENLENLKQKALQLFDDKNWDELIPTCTEIIELEKLPRVKAFTYFRRGLAYDKKGDLDRAIADFTKALELDPNHAPAYYYRGLAYDKKGDLDRAIADFTKALELDPNHAPAYYYRGLAYDKKGDLDRAIADFTKALELDPNDAPAYFYRGLTYDKKGDFDLAIADLTKALELDPNDAPAYFCRGLTYDKKGDFDLAIADLTKALELDPNDAPAYFCRGLVYNKKGDLDRTIADLTEALELDPSYVLAYYYRGLVYNKKGDLDRTIADLTKALELDPNYALAYLYRGQTHDKKGDLDRAIADLTKGLELDPNYAPAYYHRALAYDKKGDLDQAIADLTKGLELDPNYAPAYYHRGLAYDKKGDLDLAIVDLTKALELDPNDAPAYYHRGLAYDKKGDLDLAIADLTKALELDPNDAPAYYHRGLAYDKKGDLDLAIADLTKALELDPNDALAYLYRALEYSRKNDLDLAIADLNKMLELKSSDTVKSGAHFFRGTVYLRKGNFLKAFDDFVDSNKYNPDFKFIYPQNYIAFQIDDIYKEGKEDKAKAFELYSKLLDSIIKIKKKQFYEPEESGEVAHYTSLHTLKDLANGEHFRFYNAAYMNDPEEGSVFFDIEIIEESGVKEAFYKEDEDPPYLSPAYIGSFVMVGSKNQEQRDKLFLWRTYGKHNEQEAAGACLIFRHEETRFAKTYDPQVGEMQQLQSKLSMVAGDLKNPGERQHSKPALYKILYMDEETEKELSKELDELAESLEQVKHHVSEGEYDIENKLKRLTRELLDNIRFLFKASHYKEEQEVRVVQFCYYNKNMLQGQDIIKVDTEQIPPRFYLDAHENFRFDEVILGPKAYGVKEWTQWLKERKRGIQAEKSEIKYGNRSF